MRLVDADEAGKYLYEHLDDLHMIAAQNAIDEMPTIDVHPLMSDWIKCSEKMPDEPGIHVLVTDGVHIMESWYEVINGEKLWVDNYTMYVNIRFGEVTHWRPMLELPKEVDKDGTRG